MHPFVASVTDSNRCAKCRRIELDHSSNATCEACPNIGELEWIESKDLLVCKSCYAKEMRAIASQLPPIEVIRKSIVIDNGIRYNGDFYNAETIAISELKTAINANPEIPSDQKDFELAKMVKDRFDKFKTRLFEINQEKLEIESRQVNLQRSLNDLVAMLRAEQRKELKIADITYTPQSKEKKISVKVSPEDKLAIGMAKIMFCYNASGTKVKWDEMTDDEQAIAVSKAKQQMKGKI